ncbi:MAG TPA: PmoA family protein, partial [Vicinamibacterales bacterium]|nr:PmoA family protein [Vicinamibacterales bacterium]
MNGSRVVIVLAVIVVAMVASTKLRGPIRADTVGPQAVAVTPNEGARRVDVTVGGKPFTSYIWPERVKKAVLDPIRSASGTIVTRGWPLAPRAGERVDHPHHVGLWFNYEVVNGLDFWNNSDEIKPAERSKMGTILHRRIVSATGGAERGELDTESDWVTPDGKVLLRERTQFVFAGDATTRTIDRTATLTAAGERVVFTDAKDGMLGMRVARQLEQPSNEPLVFTDVAGRATPVPVMDNTGVTGEYLSSEGKKGDAVWGTRGRWTLLAGNIGTQPITIAMIDHPKNPGFPTYWHARGYGLFAANPLGQQVFSNGKEKLDFALEPKQSVTFRYRLLVLSGPTTPEQVESQ